jgi:hypothetical protein
VQLPTKTALAQLSAPPPPINTYVDDPGRVGDPASWRTPEFTRDVGMLSLGAEFPYAAGYSGTDINIGIVDSGTFAGHMREQAFPSANMHGVAFNADIYVGTTHKTDGVLYGFLPATRRDNFKI